MREQSNGLAGPNIAAGGGKAVSSKESLGLMRICSVPKASFPVLQERLVLSVDDFFRIPASAALENETEQPKKKSPAPAAQRMHFSQGSNSNSDSDSDSGTKSKRRSGSKESAAQTEPEWLLLTLAHAHWGMAREWKAGERRKAQCARAI